MHLIFQFISLSIKIVIKSKKYRVINLDKKVVLNDIIDALNRVLDDNQVFLNTDTYELVDVLDTYFTIADETASLDKIESYQAWEQEMIKEAYDVLIKENYLRLPTKYDIHDYQIMVQFSLSIDEHLSTILYDALKKKEGIF